MSEAKGKGVVGGESHDGSEQPNPKKRAFLAVWVAVPRWTPQHRRSDDHLCNIHSTTVHENIDSTVNPDPSTDQRCLVSRDCPCFGALKRRPSRRSLVNRSYNSENVMPHAIQECQDK